MGWEIGGGGEAKVAVGRSCAHAEHGKLRANEEGRETKMKEAVEGKDEGEKLEVLIDDKSGGVAKRCGHARRGTD